MSNFSELLEICKDRNWELQILHHKGCWVMRAVSYESHDHDAIGCGKKTFQAWHDCLDYPPGCDFEKMASETLHQIKTIDAFMRKDEAEFQSLLAQSKDKQ